MMPFTLSDSPAVSVMGHPDKITPDVIEWILSDGGVVRRWEGYSDHATSRRAFHL